MNTLPQDLEDIVMDYKDQMERLELQKKIDENNFKVNSVRVLCCNRDYLIRKSIEDETSNTSYGFLTHNGGFVEFGDRYNSCLKKSYEKNFQTMIDNKLDNIRQKNIELQMEKLAKYGEEVEEISEELDEGLIVIGDDNNGIAIGVTGNNYQNTFGIGITNYNYMYNNMMGTTDPN